MTSDARMTAHIAERVMGWTWDEERRAWRTRSEVFGFGLAGVYRPSFDPLHNPTDAMEALEGWRTASNPDVSISVEAWKFGWYVEHDEHLTGPLAFADLPRAICRALCAATGYREKEAT